MRKNAYTHAPAYVHTFIHMHECIHAQAHACMHAQTCEYMHTHMHTLLLGLGVDPQKMLLYDVMTDAAHSEDHRILSAFPEIHT